MGLYINSTVSDYLYLERPVAPYYFHEVSFESFDKDGFDLNQFETGLYIINEVPVNFMLNREANQFRWLEDPFNGKNGIRYDHSLTMARYGYAGALRQQILSQIEFYPLLYKLLQIIPKWGLDINVEYVCDSGEILDVFHYESDFREYNEFLETKEYLEQKIKDTNFEEIAKHLLDNYNEWSHLTGDDQNDYRARLVGLDRAYKTYKVI